MLDEVEMPKRGRPKKVEETEQPKTVWVKCVVGNKPWAGEIPLEYWKDYEIKTEDAALFEEKKWAVILNKGE